MNTSSVILYLELLQAQDKRAQEERLKTTAATICEECNENTTVGRYPFWHRYGRSLCSSCGKDYTELLKNLKAWDD